MNYCPFPFDNAPRSFTIQICFKKVADTIRILVDDYSQAFPALLEIPSKDHPYDPEKDSVLKKVKKMFGDESH